MKKKEVHDKERKNTKIIAITLLIVLIGTLVVTTAMVVYNTSNMPNIIFEEPKSEETATVALNLLPPEGQPSQK